MELVRHVEQHQAVLNITCGRIADGGQAEQFNDNLRDPLPWDMSDEEVKRIAAEAIRNGSLPGIPSHVHVNFDRYRIDRFAAQEGLPNRMFLRPKTEFGL